VKNGVRPRLKGAMRLETLDFNKKILCASWHPRENTIAVRHIPHDLSVTSCDPSSDYRDNPSMAAGERAIGFDHETRNQDIE